MAQRGVTLQEIEVTLNERWQASDIKEGTNGKVKVFAYYSQWEGESYKEKEVTVYFKTVERELILLAVKARYGEGFERSG
jgi:hypothetical protein